MTIEKRIDALERQSGGKGVAVDTRQLSEETQAQLHYVDGKLDIARLSNSAKREILQAADMAALAIGCNLRAG